MNVDFSQILDILGMLLEANPTNVLIICFAGVAAFGVYSWFNFLKVKSCVNVSNSSVPVVNSTSSKKDKKKGQ